MSALASNAQTQLKNARKAMVELDQAMIEAYKSELGERKWDEEKETYTPTLHPEEKRMMNDMERTMTRCMETMDRVIDAYIEHLGDTAKKPLTFNTPDEDAKLDAVMQTNKEYKAIRTLYSDQMIDADTELAAGKDISEEMKERMEETKYKYDMISVRLCEDAFKYEEIYREELAQRVSAHFTAEQQLLRGVGSAMKDLYPYTRGLTLDWEEMRQERKQNLAAARGRTDDMAEVVELGDIQTEVNELTREEKYGTAATTSSDSMQTQAATAAAAAASTLSKVGKSAQTNVANLFNQYAPKPTKSVASAAKTGLGYLKFN